MAMTETLTVTKKVKKSLKKRISFVLKRALLIRPLIAKEGI